MTSYEGKMKPFLIHSKMMKSTQRHWTFGLVSDNSDSELQCLYTISQEVSIYNTTVCKILNIFLQTWFHIFDPFWSLSCNTGHCGNDKKTCFFRLLFYSACILLVREFWSGSHRTPDCLAGFTKPPFMWFRRFPYRVS